MPSNGFPCYDANVKAPEAMFDRNRDRSKRKNDDKGDEERRSFKGKKEKRNRYDLEEAQKKRDSFKNNNSSGNSSDGTFVPPLPPMPPPQNQMPNQMGLIGNMMGMMGNMMGGMMNPMAMMGPMGNMSGSPMGNISGNPMGNMGGPMGNMGQFGSMMPPLPADVSGSMVPSLPGQGQMMPEFMNVFQQINTREPIDFADFRLYPPPPNAPPQTTRDRPLGCKTIFVGGLPENFKESQLEELFSKCGEIHSIRLSTKRFAHIRFMSEMSVDIALYFSGYRVRIQDLTDGPNTGRIHIDFALARDDQYEYECQQRALDRERRHQERMMKEQFRVPSPPVVVHYTDHEAATLSDKLKNPDTFREALEVMSTWLERGECNKKNASTFYSLLQSTNSHVRHLVTEKAVLDDELQRAKDMHAQRTIAMGAAYTTIEKVFLAASQKKVWDHFSKAQRKSIDAWKKAATDMKTLMPDEDDMETDSEDEGEHKKRMKQQQMGESKQALKDENDSLRCQLEAYKNEIEILKLDLSGDVDNKDKELQLTRKMLESTQGNLMEAKLAQRDSEIKTASLQKELLSLKQKLKAVKNVDAAAVEEEEELKEEEKEASPLPITQDISDLDAELIGLISIFLHIHPFGASVEYIWSYAQKFSPSVKSADLESCMVRFPTLFKQEISGIGANIERRWKYVGIKP